MILCSNPKAQYLSHKDEIDDAIHKVLSNGRYILGEELEAFEEEFARYIGVSYGIGVGSGTEAIHLALRACNIGPKDEVVTVSHTAVATVAAIELAGATPVLVDIESDYFTIDPNKLEEIITPHTKAIIPVHLYGQPADLTPILNISYKKGIRIVEDCAQSHGAMYKGRRVGSWGDMACFSFYPTKNLGAFGDAGIVVTNDSALADRVRLLREYGWVERYISHNPGYNSRLDELQAAILRVKLPYLDVNNERRGTLADLYNHALDGTNLILPKCRPQSNHVYHLYVVRSQRRDALRACLKERSISTLVHYPVPVHLQPAYYGRFRGSNCLQGTEKVATEVLSLPIYPELTESELQTVVAIRECEEKCYD